MVEQSTEAGPTRLTIDSSADPDGAVRLVLAGEVDLTTAGALEGAVQNAERGNPAAIVLDMDQLSFIDSSGLRVLLLAARRGQRVRRRLVLVNVSRSIRRVLELTALDRTLLIADAGDRT